MLNVIAYTRVSTKQQAVRGSSLDGQKLQIKAFVKARGLHVRRWFTDAESARNEEDGTERSGFIAACELSKKTGWPIIVVDACRFSRTEESYDAFVRQGGKVYDISGFGAGEAEMAGKIARAKFDGDKRSKGTREGQENAKAKGVKFGTPAPMNGAKASAAVRGKDAYIRKGELERLRDGAAQGGVTGAKELAAWLNRKGYLTAQGRLWTASNVRGRLRERVEIDAVYWPAIPMDEMQARPDLIVAETKASLEQNWREDEQTEAFYANNPDWGRF